MSRRGGKAMREIVFWIYLANAVVLINHEVDSGYWKEWELVGMKGGISLFLLLHFPLFFVLLWGLVETYKGTMSGLVVSLVMSGIGIFAAVAHALFLRKGNEKFRLPVSVAILIMTGILSPVQLALTVYLMNI
jgi:hypothetical protein